MPARGRSATMAPVRRACAASQTEDPNDAPLARMARDILEEIRRRAHVGGGVRADRESTPLKSRHSQISYALLCFEKKKKHSPCVTSLERAAPWTRTIARLITPPS